MHRVRGRAIELTDARVLFDPAKEDLNAPALAVKLADREGRQTPAGMDPIPGMTDEVKAIRAQHSDAWWDSYNQAALEFQQQMSDRFDRNQGGTKSCGSFLFRDPVGGYDNLAIEVGLAMQAMADFAKNLDQKQQQRARDQNTRAYPQPDGTTLYVTNDPSSVPADATVVAVVKGATIAVVLPAAVPTSAAPATIAPGDVSAPVYQPEAGNATPSYGNIGLPSEVTAVPVGSTGIRITGANSGDPSAAIADAASTLTYLKHNSPTLDMAVRTVVEKMGYIGIAPVAAASGGSAVSNTAVYGTGIIYIQDGGGIIYPAYTLAHEIGHLYDFATGGSAGPSSLNMTPEQRIIAPNASELQAFNFANKVAAEIRQNTGQNFAAPVTYTDFGPGKIAPGPSFPQLP